MTLNQAQRNHDARVPREYWQPTEFRCMCCGERRDVESELVWQDGQATGMCSVCDDELGRHMLLKLMNE